MGVVPHHQLLELRATEALVRRDFAAAYRFADRRCRIEPRQEAHCYVLRADAHFGLRRRSAGLKDLMRALEIAPDDVAANRRLLGHGYPSQQRKAALSLISIDCDAEVLRRACTILQSQGVSKCARLSGYEDWVEGWAVWNTDSPLQVCADYGGNLTSWTINRDLTHPLNNNGRLSASSIRIPIPTSAEPIMISLSVDRDAFYSMRVRDRTDRAINAPAVRPDAGEHNITIIVPVYADYDATKLCLDRVLRQVAHRCYHVIIVNDATPDARLKAYLDTIAASEKIRIIHNRVNLGFVGSINRALAETSPGDVLLLNADTIVPENFVERLARAAHSAKWIGTVTPFSNNGEFTSFPVPFESNPIDSIMEIEITDRITAETNGDNIIDMPNGIGFCLYVTKECLQVIGELSNNYERGYLEDVDFCLRARRKGFRNVCATGIFVGHAGSRSFKAEKRSLVMRNLSVLRNRFADYERECTAFVAADPLKPARAAIERERPCRIEHADVIISGKGTVGRIAGERAKQLAADGSPVLLMQIRNSAMGPVIECRNPTGATPQSLEFPLALDSEMTSLCRLLRSWEVSRIEFADPANTPRHLVEILLSLELPHDVLVIDAGILTPSDIPFDISMFERSAGFTQSSELSEVLSEWQEYWGRIINSAEAVLVPCRRAEAFASRFLPKQVIKSVRTTPIKRSTRRFKRGLQQEPELGIIPLTRQARDQIALHDLLRELNQSHGGVPVTVLGSTIDDTALMRMENVFVTGAVEAPELAKMIQDYGLGALLIFSSLPIFGHPLSMQADALDIPNAFVDWSNGFVKAKPGDLALCPQWPAREAAAALSSWLDAVIHG